MVNTKAFEERIYAVLPSLPANQKNVANFFLEHKDFLALIPIQDVAREASVSKASVVRFARSLGFRGYKELKENLSESLKNRLSPTEQYRMAASEMEKTPDVLKLVVNNVTDNIHATIKSLDYRTFSNAVDAIIAAQHIYCFGLELSSHLSRLMTFLLRLYSYDAHALSMDTARFQEQIAFFTPRDLVIAFSFSPYSRETVEAVYFAKDKGIPSIAFTDTKIAPIRGCATYCIQIKTDNIMFSNSLGAVAVVINAIITELNFRDKERTLRALQIIEESIKDDRYFITK